MTKKCKITMNKPIKLSKNATMSVFPFGKQKYILIETKFGDSVLLKDKTARQLLKALEKTLK